MDTRCLPLRDPVRFVAGAGNSVGFERVDSLALPSSFRLRHGERWTPCTEEEGEEAQVEGMVADARRGFLFAAQEDVGIWRIPVGGARSARPKLIDRVREFGQEYTREFDEEEEEFVCEIDESSRSFGSDYLAADAEGLTIYPLRGAGRGYLLASSQGSSTFVVYDLASLRKLRTFAIGDGATDAVENSDGAMVVGLPLGAFACCARPCRRLRLAAMPRAARGSNVSSSDRSKTEGRHESSRS